jgi:hypothetical protein
MQARDQLEISLPPSLERLSRTIYSQCMAQIDDNFWPASLAHLMKPYLSDSSQYVTIGEISSEPLNNFPGTTLLYTAMVPADEADECLVRLGGIGHGISHLEGQQVYDPAGGNPSAAFWVESRRPITNGISRWWSRGGYMIDIFCCRSRGFCSITDSPREFFQT